MATVHLTLKDTLEGGVSIHTDFQPAVGELCTAAQGHALEILARTNKQWGISPADSAPAFGQEHSASPTPTTLPALGTPFQNGIFAGLTTQKDGTHCAVVLLPGHGKKLNWKDATAWAKEQGGELPNRLVAALLFANVKDHLQPQLHWTNEEDGASYAWFCYFDDGYPSNNHKSFEGSAVAVRLIQLTA